MTDSDPIPILDWDRPNTLPLDEGGIIEVRLDETNSRIGLPVRVTHNTTTQAAELELGPYTFEAVEVSRLLYVIAQHQRINALLDTSTDH